MWQREELSSAQVSGRCRLRVAAGHRGRLRRAGTAGYGMIGGPKKKVVPETTSRLEGGTTPPGLSGPTLQLGRGWESEAWGQGGPPARGPQDLALGGQCLLSNSTNIYARRLFISFWYELK